MSILTLKTILILIIDSSAHICLYLLILRRSFLLGSEMSGNVTNVLFANLYVHARFVKSFFVLVAIEYVCRLNAAILVFMRPLPCIHGLS